MTICWAASVATSMMYLHVDPDGLGTTSPLQAATWLDVVKFNPLLHLPEFITGMAAGLLFLRRSPTLSGWAATLSFLAALSILGSLMMSERVPYLLFHNGLLSPLYAWLVYLLAVGEGPLVGILRASPMILLGEASYALYVLHRPLWSWWHMGRSASGVDAVSVWSLVPYILTAILLSVITLKVVEQPARKVLRSRLEA
mgnify:FL=1